MAASDSLQPSPNPAQKAFENVNAGGDINASIHQEINYPPAPREKPTGIPNNSPLGTGKFVGRTQALKDLHTQLIEHPMGIAAIVGMGGLGKSELAIQYARRYQDAYLGGICWLNARTGDLLTQLIQYCQLHLGMVLPQELTQQSLSVAETATWYRANWRLDGEVLVVLDDVVTLGDCKALLDLLSPRYRKLITTRDPSLDASFYQLLLEVLHPDDALELLTALVGDRIQAEQTTAQTLCETLGYLPLGVELVGRYLATNPFITVAEVSQSLSLRSQQLMPQSVSMMANQRGVWAAFELSWERLDETAQQLAQLLSFFAPGDISWALVEQVIAQTELDDTALAAAKTQLYQQSLLQQADGATLRLHPLIQEFFTAQRQEHPNHENWQHNYIHGLATFAGDIPYVIVLEAIEQLTPAIPHLIALLRQSLESISDESLGPLFRGVTYFYNSQAIYAEAQSWAEQGMAVLQERLGGEHLDTAIMIGVLALLYSDQGRYSDAEPLFLQAIDIGKRTLGEEHPAVAARLNNLALLYKAQGRYSDAEPLFLQALEITKRTLGEEHPAVATRLNNLALLRRDKRRRRSLSMVRWGLLGLLIGIAIHSLIVFVGTQNSQVLFRLIVVVVLAGFLWRWHPK